MKSKKMPHPQRGGNAKRNLGERRALQVWNAVGHDPEKFRLIIQIAELILERDRGLKRRA